MKRHEAWLKHAHSELRFGGLALENGFYAQACFIAQQVAEMALKAIAYYRRADAVKAHSIKNISQALGINGKIETYGRKLDMYYTSTRCPDALPDNIVPAEFFTVEQAREALQMAKEILEIADKEVKL